jgi:hypothetical protein
VAPVRREADGVTVLEVAPDAGPKDVVDTFAVAMREAPTPLLLWDLRQARFNRFTNDELRWIASQLVASSRADCAARGKSAFVVTHDADYGMMRMLIAHVELGGYRAPLQVFRDERAARSWLLGRVDE